MTEITNFNAAKTAKENRNDIMSPVETLEDTIRAIKAGEINPNKLLILHLRSDEEGYCQGFRACDMKISEMLALCETIKPIMLEQMGLIND